MNNMSDAKLGSLQLNVKPILDMNKPYKPKKEDFINATNEEKQSITQNRPSVSFWKDAMRRLKKNKVAMVALAVIIILVVFAFIGPLVVPYDYAQQIRGSENLSPMKYSEAEMALKASGESVFPHIFGTDGLGRDLMVRVMYGTRVSMIIGLVASFIVLIIGSIYGSVSGYCGGIIDTIMMRIVDIIYSVPEVLVVLLLMVVLHDPLQNLFSTSNISLFKSMSKLGAGLISIFITFGLLYWVGMARIIRGQVLMLKQQEYVTAAKALGASGVSIIKKHLLPNCLGQLIVTTCLQIPSAIFLESFLSFLGLGVSAPLASLGSLASDGLGGIYTYTYRLVIPAIVLSIMILALNLFGDGLRDALDPRLKK